MNTLQKIPVRRVMQSRIKDANFDKFAFGSYVSDHMFVVDYDNAQWSSPHIVPFANLSLDPSTLALHYGQTVFEGMKAFRMIDGRINIFRLDRHYDRFVKSLERMCMAVPSAELFEQGIRELVAVDREWAPAQAGCALYIRPFIYASEARMGVKVSEQYRFVIYTGPVPEIYPHPIKVKVEQEFIRAARGGTGFAKCGGNYGGAFYPTHLARQQGYEQVLWTNGEADAGIEESGMMNAMFVINGVLVTAPLSDSILDGVTRDSLLTLADHLNIPVEERQLRLSELERGLADGSITEAFGAGTAAVVAPIGTIGLNGIDIPLPEPNSHSVQSRLKRKLDDIRYGRDEDLWAWNNII